MLNAAMRSAIGAGAPIASSGGSTVRREAAAGESSLPIAGRAAAPP